MGLVYSPAGTPDKSRTAWMESSLAIRASQTERGARNLTSTEEGGSSAKIRVEAFPTTSSGMGLGKVRTSFGSAALTADTQTEMPSASAKRNVRRFFANKRMLILLAE